MAKAKRLSRFERGRIVELLKQGLLQRIIAAEVGCSNTVILNFLKDPKRYGTKKSSGRSKKNSPALSRRMSEKTEAYPQPKLRPLLMLTAAQ